MGRIANAQGGNNPEKYRCSLCGMCGHNCRSCTNTRPLPVRGVKKCGCCGEVGHNRRTCPKMKEEQVEQKFQAELALLLADEADEEPLQQDLELTPTPRSETEEEVDVATEGYREICGLNHDLMLMVGEQVGEIRVKINLEWWCNRIQMPVFTGENRYWQMAEFACNSWGKGHIVRRPPQGRLPQVQQFIFVPEVKEQGWRHSYCAEGVQRVCREIEDISRIVGGSGFGWYPATDEDNDPDRVGGLMEHEKPVHLGMCMKPRYTKWKKVRKHTWAWKESNRMSGCPSTYWSWRHTLSERREIQQAHADYYSVPR
jgi:hypothetical protein